METGNQRILLAAALLAFTGQLMAEGRIDSIIPELDRREFEPVAIDTEDFEIGPYAGIISIQDFDSEWIYGLRAAWHVTEDVFFEASYGTSEGDLTSYEKISGAPPLFDDADRDYSYHRPCVITRTRR